MEIVTTTMRQQAHGRPGQKFTVGEDLATILHLQDEGISQGANGNTAAAGRGAGPAPELAAVARGARPRAAARVRPRRARDLEDWGARGVLAVQPVVQQQSRRSRAPRFSRRKPCNHLLQVAGGRAQATLVRCRPPHRCHQWPAQIAHRAFVQDGHIATVWLHPGAEQARSRRWRFAEAGRSVDLDGQLGAHFFKPRAVAGNAGRGAPAWRGAAVEPLEGSRLGPGSSACQACLRAPRMAPEAGSW